MDNSVVVKEWFFAIYFFSMAAFYRSFKVLEALLNEVSATREHPRQVGGGVIAMSVEEDYRHHLCLGNKASGVGASHLLFGDAVYGRNFNKYPTLCGFCEGLWLGLDDVFYFPVEGCKAVALQSIMNVTH